MDLSPPISKHRKFSEAANMKTGVFTAFSLNNVN